MRFLIIAIAASILFFGNSAYSQQPNILLLRINDVYLSGTEGIAIDRSAPDLAASYSFSITKGNTTQLRVFVNRLNAPEALAQPFLDSSRLRFYLPNQPACASVTETTGTLTIYTDGSCNGGDDTLLLAAFILSPNLQEIEHQNFFLFRVVGPVRLPPLLPPR